MCEGKGVCLVVWAQVWVEVWMYVEKKGILGICHMSHMPTYFNLHMEA